jgi:hypothetical protein
MATNHGSGDSVQPEPPRIVGRVAEADSFPEATLVRQVPRREVKEIRSKSRAQLDEDNASDQPLTVHSEAPSPEMATLG